MKKIFLLMGIATTMILTSCTGNQRAKNFGGNYSIELEPGQMLVEATWKGEANLWYLTKARPDGVKPTTYTFHEDSSLGIVEGTVTFIER